MRKSIFFEYYQATIILMILPIFVIGMAASVLIREYTQNNKKHEQISYLRYSQEVFEIMFDNINGLNNTLRFYPSVTKKLRDCLSASDKELGYDEFKEFSSIRDLLFYSVIVNKNIYSIYIYFDNPYGNFISSKHSYMSNINAYSDSDWIKSCRNRPRDTLYWSEVRYVKDNVSMTSKKVYTVYYRLMNSVNKPDGGVIVCNLDLDELTRSWNRIVTEFNSDYNANVIILDEDNNLIAQRLVDIKSDEAMLSVLSGWKESNSFVKIDNKEYIVFSYNSDFSKFRYLSLVQTSKLFWLSERIFVLTVIITLFGILLTMWFAMREAKRNYQKLNDLYKMIISANKNMELPPQLPKKGMYNLVFNSMLTTLIEQKMMKLQLSEKKNSVLEMSIIALQSQINPHFLFNTLESIKWKCITLTGGPSELSEIIMRLSEIMRYSLDSPTTPVELSRELDILEKYIEIHKIRFPGKIDVIWDVSEESKKCWILKLLLQPILENCIKHGRDTRKEQLLIKVRTYLKAHNLIIKIIDNGNGIRKEDLKVIRENILDRSGKNKHIGLTNVHYRLQTIYGPQYGLKIGSVYGRGSIVKLILPERTAKYDIFRASSYEDEEWQLEH